MTVDTGRPDVSVVICTRNRAESLRMTLESLASADREGISAEVLIVDNGSEDDTEGATAAFATKVPLRYLREATVGKCFALNRGIAEGRGEIFAVLDDDMSVDRGWFKAVVDVCRRHPDRDIFGGTVRIVWPTANVPGWAKHAGIKGEIFSAGEFSSEADLEGGMWFSGNHFWFRSQVLDRGVRFEDIWITEGKFQLDLIEMGCRGLSCPGAIADHRLQPDLLHPEVVIGRARKAGRAFARLRLQPYRSHVRSARMMHEHPLLTRAYCVARHFIGLASYCMSSLHSIESDRFAERVIAINRCTLNVEYIRVANRWDEYSVWRSARNRARAA